MVLPREGLRGPKALNPDCGLLVTYATRYNVAWHAAGEGPPPAALLLDCGPGGVAFELGASFSEVLAQDACARSIRAAQVGGS